MSKEMQIFKNEEFGKVRVIIKNGEPIFALKDLCRILEVGNPSDVKKRLGDGVVSIEVIVDNLGRNQKVTFVNESGLYDVILDSRKPNARRFRKWIVEEVLPSIRKTGMYVTEQKKYELINNPDAIIEICNQWKQEIEKNKQLTKENAIMQPKAKYYDEVLNSSSLIPITRIAKEYGLSGQTLNRLLCKWEIQYKQGGVFVLYQGYANEGYAYYVDYPYIDDNGDTQTSQLLKWTQKGREFLHYVLTSNGYNRRKDLRNIIEE